MPELPEVETVRRQLEPALVGKRIKSASVLDERLTRPEPPRSVERAVAGRAVRAGGRRGKPLLSGLGGAPPLPPRRRMRGILLLRGAGGAGGGGEAADLMRPDPPGGPRRFESAAEPNYVRARFQLDDGEE